MLQKMVQVFGCSVTTPRIRQGSPNIRLFRVCQAQILQPSGVQPSERRHSLVPIKDASLKPLRHRRAYRTEGFQGGLHFSSNYAEIRSGRFFFPSREKFAIVLDTIPSTRGNWNFPRRLPPCATVEGAPLKQLGVINCWMGFEGW